VSVKQPRVSVEVLRIGHRFVRDDRTITHLCLVSRAFGAETIYLQEVEKELRQTVDEVNHTWGGDFHVVEQGSWKKIIEKSKKENRVVVHLTMYGLPIADVVNQLRMHDKFLLVVGGPKVPGEVYRLADFNIAVTSQPHSEVAALAVAIHEILEGEELKKELKPGKIRIIPTKNGKRVENIV
jgi:tRNA (cytidine56-2'-O)-methyltransferase